MIEHNNIIIEHLSNTSSQAGALAIVFGAFVGAIRKVLSFGWKGWLWFISSMIVNVLIGLVAYLYAVQANYGGLYPVIFALVFGFMGEKAGDTLLAWAFKKMGVEYINKEVINNETLQK